MQKIDINECVIQCVDTVEYQLSRFNVEFADGVDNDLANLFMSALKKGEVTPGEKADEYAKIISMKIEAGLVLKYGSDVDLLTHEFVCDFCKELLGEDLGNELIIQEREPEIVKLSSIIGRLEIPRPQMNSGELDEDAVYYIEDYAELIPNEKLQYVILQSIFRDKNATKDIIPIDRFVAHRLVDLIVDLFDEYINAEDKDSALMEFFIKKTCATIKLNEILQDDLCDFADLDDFAEGFGKYTKNIIDYRNKYMDFLEDFIKKGRNIFIAIRGEDA